MPPIDPTDDAACHDDRNEASPPLVAAFVVGMNPEWQYERSAHGDLAFFHALRRFCRKNCDLYWENHQEEDIDFDSLLQFVSEHDATTVQALEERLESFLEHITAVRRRSKLHGAIHLVLYLGGHGEPGCYCLPKDPTAPPKHSSESHRLWRHGAMVNALERYLTEPGDHVWMLVDTCYSGTFVDAFHNQKPPETLSTLWAHPNHAKQKSIRGRRYRQYQRSTRHSTPPPSINVPLAQSRNSTSVLSYSILMSTARDSLAGPDWTLTDGWIQAMEGRLRRGSGEGAALSTQEVVDSIQDLIRRVKENEMQYASIGPNDFSSQPFPFCSRARSKVSNPMPPPLFHSQSMDMDHVTSQLNSLHVEGNRRTLSKQQIAHCLFARNGQYRDYSSYAAGTKLWIQWKDETRLYSATVVEDCDVPWENFYEIPTSNEELQLFDVPLPEMCGAMGSCIPVLWHEEQTYSFVPVRQCAAMPSRFSYLRRPPNSFLLRQHARQSEREEFHRLVSLTSSIHMDCLLRSFESAGKTLLLGSDEIRRALSLTSTANADEQWQVQWVSNTNEPWNSTSASNADRMDDAPEKLWRNVCLSNSISSIDDLSMEAFISHLNYKEQGCYCIISWSIDENCLRTPTSTIQMCVPLANVRRVDATL